jgi:hypothetical protein
MGGTVRNASYSGVAWVDVDGDGWLDLYVPENALFRNLGNGNFAADSTALASPATSLGHAWADFDNDGDVDCLQAGAASLLFENDGTGQFARVTVGDMADSTGNRGFSAAWGDYDDDGWVDLLITHFTNGIAGSPNSNQLFHNESGTLVRNLATPITADSSTYIIGTWVDWDDDGDVDLSIGRGPFLAFGTDDFYRNRQVEDGIVSFERVTTGALVTDLRDGQNHAWVDYDNDGDLDIYITNYSGQGGVPALANDLYRNDAGTYVEMTVADAGPIVGNTVTATSCVWADFDNDGWLDCMTTSDGANRIRYYTNDGDGSFTRDDTVAMYVLGRTYSASAGDYDRDGDVDLFVASPLQVAGGLFRNDHANGNHWLNVHCESTVSNRSAIGTRVRAKAVVAGTPMWQRRDVLSQDVAAGTSSLEVEFGFGDASVVDSLVVDWPSGTTQVFTSVAVDQFLSLVEPGGAVSVTPATSPALAGARLSLSPNPFVASTDVRFDLARRQRVRVEVVDLLGRRVRTLVDEDLAAGEHALAWDGRDESSRAVAAGIYFVRFSGESLSQTRRVVRLR